MTQETTKATFRYKFSEILWVLLLNSLEFISLTIQKFSNNQDWIKDNKELVNTESDRL